MTMPRSQPIVPQSDISRPCCAAIDAHTQLGASRGGWDIHDPAALFAKPDQAGAVHRVDIVGGCVECIPDNRLQAGPAREAQGPRTWKPSGLQVTADRRALAGIDDPRLAVIWATAGELNLPDAILQKACFDATARLFGLTQKED